MDEAAQGSRPHPQFLGSGEGTVARKGDPGGAEDRGMAIGCAPAPTAGNLNLTDPLPGMKPNICCRRKLLRPTWVVFTKIPSEGINFCI